MEHWNSFTPIHQQEEFFEVHQTSPTVQRNSIVTSSSNSSSALTSMPFSAIDNELLNTMKTTMSKMISTLERLEQRLNRVEQTTSQILKNQQEILQVPFISQSELDNARKVAEQLEQDTAVAKQLQAAYNKEVEVRKNMAPQNSQQWKTIQTTMINHNINQGAQQCPICGGRYATNELELHVENCLNQFSEDPKKENVVQETKKKIDTGFFGRLYKSTKTTEKTKVITSPNSATAPLLGGDHDGMMINPNNYYPQAYGYPMMMPHPSMQHQMIPQNGYWPNYNGYPSSD